jgi:unsaturated rhamnogalacturonyl hydrolase
MQTTRPEHESVSSDRRWSARMADSVIARHSAGEALWHYEHGLMLQAIEQVWRATGDETYWRFVKDTVDLFIGPDGEIRTYRLEEYNLDQINPGKVLFPLYEATGEERYRQAIVRLRRQFDSHPRTDAGGFWHKQIYPYQMWLDGIYMAAPFYARYAQAFGEPAVFDDIAHQIILVEQRTRDPETGLLYHAWDERRKQGWANPETGCSPHFWGRAMGWYAMALVDVLDYFPADHPQRQEILDVLSRTTEAIAGVQDRETGLWYQVLDQGDRAGNYLESSASCMFVYAVAKGVRQGHLSARYQPIADRGYRGILESFITVDDSGLVSLEKVCAVAGLGGNPYRDGSFDYYVNERVAANDYKGVGPCILASLEMEHAARSNTEQDSV